MKGLIDYEWEKLYRGRPRCIHGGLYVITAGLLLHFSNVYEDAKVLILARSSHAQSFIATANDLIYLCMIVYAVWLSSRLFIVHPSDCLTVQVSNRFSLTLSKWLLGAASTCTYALFAWLVTHALLNTLPYSGPSLLTMNTLCMGLMHALQAFSLFALLAWFFKTPHTFMFVLTAVFMVDTLRSGLYRPESLNHGHFLSHAILPAFAQSSDGNLIVMVSPWLSFLLNGLIVLTLIVLGLIKEY